MTPFTIATNSIEYLGVTLTKNVKDLYDKNFKTLKKEMEEDLKNGKTSFVPSALITGSVLNRMK